MTASKMYIMTRSRVLFTVVCSFLFLLVSFGQSVDQLIDFADEKYQQGQFELAAKEYQRALFFGPKENVGPLSMATGDCFFELQDYSEAEKYYRFAANLIREDSLKAEVLLKKSSCLLLDHHYQLAVFDLLNLPYSLPSSLEKKKNHIAWGGLLWYE
jgi:tetratricopeptide (TPR) repeat protein